MQYVGFILRWLLSNKKQYIVVYIWTQSNYFFLSGTTHLVPTTQGGCVVLGPPGLVCHP